MVCIYYDGGDPVTMSLEELQTKTPAQIIEEIIKNATDCSSVLTRCGIKFPNDKTLSSASISEDDFLRIIHMESSPSSVNAKMSEEEIDALRKECSKKHRSMYRENNRALLNDMYSRLTHVDFFKEKLQEFPELSQHPDALPYVADPFLLFTILTNPDNRQLCLENPVLLLIIQSVIRSTYQRFGIMDGPPLGSQQRGQQVQPNPSGGITAEFLQQAINFAMNNANVQQGVPAQQFVQPNIAVPQNNPLEEARQRFSAELAQMREFGFMDDDLNLTILMQCQGNVATAMEILIDTNS